MALIQITSPTTSKRGADAAFARNGITTPAAMKMMVTQVRPREPHPVRRSLLLPGRTRTRRGRTPRHAARRGPGIRLIADDATDARTIPDDVLGELGLTAQEVGQ